MQQDKKTKLTVCSENKKITDWGKKELQVGRLD
jgi:hypothetical protein